MAVNDATAPGEGLVVAAHGRRGQLRTSDGQTLPYLVPGRRLKIVCGDRVEWQPATAGEPCTVTSLLARDNELQRVPARPGPPEVLAANVTLVAVVVAAQPVPDWFLVDRYLCAAENMAADGVLVNNKSELGNALAGELAVYARIGYPVLNVSAHAGDGLGSLSALFAGQTGILVGQSGVGKSSLLNALVPAAERATASLSTSSAEGRHTTTASMLYRLPDGGQLIDTPGVRDFLPAIDDVNSIASGFRELYAAAARCRFANCRHLREPGCAVKAGVDAGTISERRYESYKRLFHSLDNRD